VFPDHHEYAAADAERIAATAGERAVVTTAKDHIKLGSLLPAERVWILEQRVEVDTGSDAIARALDGLER
jgi:tetraacyldisaccharide-1-P 4'-kinase